jgi:hypothetical protein
MPADSRGCHALAELTVVPPERESSVSIGATLNKYMHLFGKMTRIDLVC